MLLQHHTHPIQHSLSGQHVTCADSLLCFVSHYVRLCMAPDISKWGHAAVVLATGRNIKSATDIPQSGLNHRLMMMQSQQMQFADASSNTCCPMLVTAHTRRHQRDVQPAHALLRG